MPGAAAIDDTVVELWATDRFALRDPRAAWVVEEGTVDLFVRDVHDAALAGPPRHLLRVHAGQAIFGLGAAGTAPIAAVATPSPGAKIRQTTRGALQARLAADPDDRAVVQWIDEWIASLARAACHDLVPREFVPLLADQAVDVGETPRIVAPRDGVLWMRHEAGVSRFLGRPELAEVDGTYFPVSFHGWLEAGGGSTVRGIATARWHTADPEWAGLERFHGAVLHWLALSRDLSRQREEERLRVKARAASTAFHQAMVWLSQPLRGRAAADARTESDGDPLVAACRTVGTAIGVRIVPPRGQTDGARGTHPVEAIARASSVRVRRVLLRDEWWRSDAGPLVAFKEGSERPVALLTRTANRYSMYDPVECAWTPVGRDAAATLSPTAYSFYRPFPERPMGLAELVRFGLSGCRREIALIVAMGLAGGILNLAAPIAMGIMFDAAIPGAQRGQVVALAGFLVIAAVSSALLTLTRNFATLRLQGRLDAALQGAAWDRLLRLPVAFFRSYSSGDLAVRSLAFNDMRQVLAGPVLSLVITQLFSLVSFGLLFVYSVRLALVAALLVAIAFGVSGLILYVNLQYSRRVIEMRGRLVGTVAEFLQGIAKFRLSGTEGKALAVWARLTGDRKLFTVQACSAERALMTFTAGWPLLCSAVIFYAASSMMADPRSGGLSTGRFLAFLSVFTQVVASGLQFAYMLCPVLALVPVYERAKPLLVALPEANAAKAHPGELSGAIEVNHLVFRYTPDGPHVIRDVSLTVRPGEMVAIVGASGCGKSTLLRLLLGFERPETGSIYYDGQDLAGLDLQVLRRQMGVALQSGSLGSGTLLSVILGSTGRGIGDAWDAARMTGLDQDIAAMPMGIHTMVTDGGGTLSGGQRQRLMIARAIVDRPRILLFDEATSALDNETQAIVTRSLKALRATRLIIAHRLSTISGADRIVVLDKGVIAQSGTYQELIAQDGLFRQLASRQLT